MDEQIRAIDLAKYTQYGLGEAYQDSPAGTISTQLAVINNKINYKTNKFSIFSDINKSYTNYTSLAACLTSGLDNDTLIIRGEISGTISLNKSYKLVDLSGAYLGNSTLNVGGPIQNAVGYTQYVRGFVTDGAVNVFHQISGTTKLTISDATLTDSALFFLYALGQDGPAITDITLIRCTSVRKVPGTNPLANGNIAIHARDDSQQRYTLTLIDCTFVNTLDSCITGYCHPDTRIYIKGRTTFAPKSGSPDIYLTNTTDGSAANLATIIIDQRDFYPIKSIEVVAGSAGIVGLNQRDAIIWLANRGTGGSTPPPETITITNVQAG
jgi:hypothetical protein